MTSLAAAADDRAIVFVASVGIILLLFETGLETDLRAFTRVLRSAALVAAIGVVLPFLAGFGIVLALRGDYAQALFLGAILTATSVGITARVLADLGQTSSGEAKLILAAAVIDDILGLLVLALVLQIAATGRPDAAATAKAVALAFTFLVGAVWLGIRMAPRFIALAQKLRTRAILVTSAFLFCMMLAYIARLVGLAEIVGAFAAGLVLSTTQDRVDIQRQIRPVTDIFIPVFFVLVGLRVRLAEVNPADPTHRGVVILGLALLGCAVLGKLASGLATSEPGISRLAVGVGMVPRGEVGLVFASVGLKRGVLSADLFAVAVLVVFASTVIAPPWLKRLFRGRRPDS